MKARYTTEESGGRWYIMLDGERLTYDHDNPRYYSRATKEEAQGLCAVLNGEVDPVDWRGRRILRQDDCVYTTTKHAGGWLILMNGKRILRNGNGCFLVPTEEAALALCARLNKPKTPQEVTRHETT